MSWHKSSVNDEYSSSITIIRYRINLRYGGLYQINPAFIILGEFGTSFYSTVYVYVVRTRKGDANN